MLSFSLIFSALEIVEINPDNGEAGSDLTVELIASGVSFYDFYDGYTSTISSINFYPEGVNVDSYSISSENSITMNLSIDKISANMFDVQLIGSFYDQYDQYFYDSSKEDVFYVSSNNPLLVADVPEDFGEVNVGESLTIMMSFYNPSTVNLEIHGMSFSNSDFVFGGSLTDFNIPSGWTWEGPIIFTPSSAGSILNTMTIYSNDEFDPVQVFQMSGTGFAILGDINSDGTLNILDIVALIGYVFNDNENPDADLNGDGTVNIVDVVMLVNLVLNWGF
jgi:hypothetical protein